MALFNSSYLNSIESKIAQIGSELLAHFGSTEHTKEMRHNLEFIEQGLYHTQGLDTMLVMRQAVLQGERCETLTNDDWTKGRLYWSWVADPICAVYIWSMLAEKEITGTLKPDERTVLVQ